MAQQKEEERKVGPLAIEEAVRALETLAKSVSPLKRDVERLRRAIQPLEEARRVVEPLLRELKKRAAWVKEMERHAADLRKTMPRMTARDIDSAVHEVRRELYGGTRHPSQGSD